MTLRKIVSRSPKEILFRLRQEAANLLLAAAPPSVDSAPPSPLACLPNPACVVDTLRGTAFAAHIETLARKLLRHEFPLLGLEIRTGPEIAWRRDYASGRSSRPVYFRRIPYLDFERVGDHKVIWELNRHQHLVVLAQAFQLTGDRSFLDEIVAQVGSWLRQNPYQRSINWASALEVAFRALSWTWVYHLAAPAFPACLRAEFLNSLFRHGCHLETNLSLYFSPNTHLLGEAVALHALGTAFPNFPRSRRWAEYGGATVRDQLERQVLPDGAHFELSTYYHVYALDFFLLHYILAGRPPEFRPVLERMAAFLDAVLGSSRSLPLIGDDDGGRLFHPYGDRTGFGSATLATCAVLFDRPEWLRHCDHLLEQALWWLGPDALALQPAPSRRTSAAFPQSGLFVMASESLEAVVDAGALASGGAGHSHSDSLSLIVRAAGPGTGAELLVDAGTFTYVSAPAERAWFRGSAAHNTIRIDGHDQAIPAGPFRWDAKPAVEVLAWETGPGCDYLDACCACRAFRHRRRFVFLKPDILLILDQVDGPEGDHTIERFWHPGKPVQAQPANSFSIAGCAVLSLAGPAVPQLLESGDHAWCSVAYGSRSPWPVVRECWVGTLPVCFAAAIAISESAPQLSFSLRGTEVAVEFSGGSSGSVLLPASGPPRINRRNPRPVG